MNCHKKPLILKPLAFGIASAFVYGGTVNYGVFNFLPATPFILFVFYAAWKWRKGFAIACILLFLICIPLYVQKLKHGPLFHPALGKELRTTEDTCLTLYKDSDHDFVLMTELQQNKCDSSNVGDAIRWEVLPKGSKLVISQVTVSNADFGESYIIHSKVPLGEIGIFPNHLKNLEWLDGKPVDESDLRRNIFYYPSLLMYWPMSPFMIPALFR